jgi:hypothetical protein
VLKGLEQEELGCEDFNSDDTEDVNLEEEDEVIDPKIDMVKKEGLDLLNQLMVV